MTYYIKGGSRYNAANPKVWVGLFLGGFPDADYLLTDWINLDDKGHETAQDPFYRLGGSAGGSKEFELGLWNDFRIKFETTGITYWDGDSWNDLLTGGGGKDNLYELDDVVIDGTPADNELLAWDNSSGKWINQTAGEAGLALSGHGHGQLHDEAHSLSSHSSEAHNELTGYNDETDVKHLTDAQLGALHTIYSLESHNNTYHSVTFVDAAGAVSAVNAAGLSLATTKVITSADEDLTFNFGRNQLGHTSGGNAYFGYRAFSNVQYAILQTSTFKTHINATTGQSISHRINNVEKMNMNSTNLTMSIPIDLQDNLLTVGQSTDTSDPITLIEFETERAWFFRKRGTGASANLNLECDTAGKSFNIGYTDLPVITFSVSSIDADQFIHAKSHRIRFMANAIDATDAMAFGQKYTLEQHDNDHHNPDFCVNNDGRLSDARTPTQHAMDSTTYHSRTDITVLNASTSFHGFLKKLDNSASNFMNGQGNWAVPPGTYSLEQHNNSYHSINYHTETDGTGAVTVHSGITDAGSGIIISDAERTALHPKQHAMDAVAEHTRTDITTLDASTSFHGFLKKLDGTATNYMDGSGAWSVPAGSPDADMREQSTTFPVSPNEGDLHYDEDDDSLYRYNGEALAWVEVGTMGAVASVTDNLGNHTATEDLVMGAFNITLDALSTVDGVDVSVLNSTYAAHLHDGQTLQCDDITSNSGDFNLQSVGMFQIKVSSHNNQYIQFFTSGANIPCIGAYGSENIYFYQNSGSNWNVVHADDFTPHSAPMPKELSTNKILSIKNNEDDSGLDYSSIPEDTLYEEKDGSNKGYKMNRMMLHLIKTIQELELRIKELEAK